MEITCRGFVASPSDAYADDYEDGDVHHHRWHGLNDDPEYDPNDDN